MLSTSSCGRIGKDVILKMDRTGEQDQTMSTYDATVLR